MTAELGPNIHPLQGIAIGRPAKVIDGRPARDIREIHQVFWMTSGDSGSQPELARQGEDVIAKTVYNPTEQAPTVSYHPMKTLKTYGGYICNVVANGVQMDKVEKQLGEFGDTLAAAISRYDNGKSKKYPDCSALYVTGATRNYRNDSDSVGLHTILTTGVKNGRLTQHNKTFIHGELTPGKGFAIQTHAEDADIEGIAPIADEPQEADFGRSAEDTADMFLKWLGAETSRHIAIVVKEINPINGKIHYAFASYPPEDSAIAA